MGGLTSSAVQFHLACSRTIHGAFPSHKCRHISSHTTVSFFPPPGFNTECLLDASLDTGAMPLAPLPVASCGLWCQ